MLGQANGKKRSKYPVQKGVGMENLAIARRDQGQKERVGEKDKE